MKNLIKIEILLEQLKMRKDLLIKLIGQDGGDYRYQEGKLQAITEIIGLIEGYDRPEEK